jgi:FMN phosphatase YigB (HAD superfamily)
MLGFVTPPEVSKSFTGTSGFACGRRTYLETRDRAGSHRSSRTVQRFHQSRRQIRTSRTRRLRQKSKNLSVHAVGSTAGAVPVTCPGGDGWCIRGVLFDSSGVLIRPVGGRWNPRYDFEGIVVAHHPDTRVELFPEAFAVGRQVLDAGATTANRTDYHRAMLRVLGIASPSAALLHELEAPATGPTVEVFPDVRPVLDQLRACGVGMSVVSDNWAGLEAGYRSLGIEHYFTGFVISEVLGCRKPDPRTYAADVQAGVLGDGLEGAVVPRVVSRPPRRLRTSRIDADDQG